MNPDHWGIFATRSKDGIHFESLGNVLHKWDDRFVAVTGKVDGKYRVYGRGTFETGVQRAGLWQGRTDFVTEYGLDPFPRKRPVAYTESEDLIHWTPGEQVLKTGTDDPWQMQYYSLTPFYYEGIWLAGLLRMHTIPDVLDEELVWSYDSRNWHRSIPRQPFIPRGPKGSFDSVWLNLPTNPPIVNYNQLWFYYSGRAGGHGAQFPEAYGAIGLHPGRAAPATCNPCRLGRPLPRPRLCHGGRHCSYDGKAGPLDVSTLGPGTYSRLRTEFVYFNQCYRDG